MSRIEEVKEEETMITQQEYQDYLEDSELHHQVGPVDTSRLEESVPAATKALVDDDASPYRTPLMAEKRKVKPSQTISGKDK